MFVNINSRIKKMLKKEKQTNLRFVKFFALFKALILKKVTITKMISNRYFTNKKILR